MLKAIDEFIHPIKHHLLTLSFIGGFILDNLTLARVDRLFDVGVLSFHVTLAALSIIYLYIGTSGRLSERVQLHAAKWAPMGIQFAFGSLMSGLLVFYSRSGSWLTSWPYLLLLLGVIIGNEYITKKAQRLIFNLGLFFVGLFSYCALFVPVILGKMGDAVFVGSGLLALAIMWVFVKALYFAVPNFMALNTRSIFFTIGMMYFGLNTLYFTNLIPPIPLSLSAIGVYHEVKDLGEGKYQLSFEKGEWYEFWKESDKVFHRAVGEPVFCYAAVYAPAKISTTIYHRWEYYDEEKGAWVYHARIPYAISGGRLGGYRGYTQIESVRDGQWRCSVETERGQTVGRDVFRVVTGTKPAAVVTRVDI